MDKQGMEFLKIARAIPVGARRIEQMRQEIHNTVTTLLGLVSRCPETHSIETLYGHSWSVGEGFGIPGVIVVEYGYLHSVGFKILYNSRKVSRGESSIPLEHVERIYEYLGHFIKLMYETFPELPDKLQPLIKASGVNNELFS